MGTRKQKLTSKPRMMPTEELAELLTTRYPLPSLIPNHAWREELTETITALKISPLVKAGLHVWNDDIEGCHAIAQAYATPEANYWHAILHRREPDYNNSKYWYGQVGEHPIFPAISETYPEWKPLRFVDWCQDNARKGGGKKTEGWLELVQATEMLLLLE